jgi:hypothetical protein
MKPSSTAGGGAGIIEGSVNTWTELPTPASSYVGALYYVTTGSGTVLPETGDFKYPVGLYTPNPAATDWVVTPLNVTLAEDSLTMINITNWTEFNSFQFDINIGDRLVYNGQTFVNITGAQTVTPPNLDATNWSSYIDLAPQLSVAYKEGRYFYDSVNKAHSFYSETNEVPPTREGRVLRSRVMNNESFDLVKGDIVRITGVSGTMPLVELTQANTIENVRSTIGMVMQTISPGNSGYIGVFDTIIGVDTSTAQVNSVVYLDPFNPGKFTFVEPSAPNYTLPVGFVSVVDAVNGVVGVRFGGFSGTDTTVNIEGALNGIVTARQTISFVDDGVNVYADITNDEDPTVDLPVMFQGVRYLLNTTTGAGVGGAARIALNLGSPTTPQGQFIYITLNGSTPELRVENGIPTIDSAELGIVAVKDLATFQAEGVQVYQRTNNAVNGSVDKGVFNIILEKLRYLGALYVDGVDPTITIDSGVSPDTVNLTTTAGRAFQTRLQNFTATTGIEYFILNHPVTGVTRITDLNQIDVDALGNDMLFNGVRYGLNVICGQNSENIIDKIYINLPGGSYGNDLDCINDTDNFAITSVPQGYGLNINAFRLCRICLRRNTTTGGEYINILEANGLGSFQDERGFPLGTAGGAGAGTSTQTLSSLHGDPAVTGLYTGGKLTLNGTTQLDITTGAGQIVNFYSDYQAPTKIPVSWSAQTITVPNLGIDDATYVYVDNTGAIQTQNIKPLPSDDRTKLFLGFTVNNTGLSQIEDVLNTPTPIGNTAQSFMDYQNFIGATTRGGNVSKTNDAVTNGDLALRIEEHTLFSPGISWHTSKTKPNELLFLASDPMTFNYILQTGELVTGASTLIDPLNYDNAGVQTVVPTTGNGRITTIQYIYQLINGSYHVFYGQNLYDDLSSAKSALNQDAKSLILPAFVASFGSAIAAVIVQQNCVDIGDPLTSTIEQIESGSIGGSSSSVNTNPWIRTEGSLTVPVDRRKVDVFPNADNVEITLPDPADLGEFGDIEVYNQTNREYHVILKDHLGNTLKEINPVTSFTAFFYPTVPATGLWELVQTSGAATPELPISPYGDFNNIAWDGVPTSGYILTGLGSQFLNLPTGFTLLAGSTYTFNVELVNSAPKEWLISIVMSSDSDFSNSDIGRDCKRVGSNFSSAVSVGWKCNALTTDP